MTMTPTAPIKMTTTEQPEDDIFLVVEQIFQEYREKCSGINKAKVLSPEKQDLQDLQCILINGLRQVIGAENHYIVRKMTDHYGALSDQCKQAGARCHRRLFDTAHHHDNENYDPQQTTTPTGQEEDDDDDIVLIAEQFFQEYKETCVAIKAEWLPKMQELQRKMHANHMLIGDLCQAFHCHTFHRTTHVDDLL